MLEFLVGGSRNGAPIYPAGEGGLEMRLREKSMLVAAIKGRGWQPGWLACGFPRRQGAGGGMRQGSWHTGSRGGRSSGSNHFCILSSALTRRHI